MSAGFQEQKWKLPEYHFCPYSFGQNKSKAQTKNPRGRNRSLIGKSSTHEMEEMLVAISGGDLPHFFFEISM